MNIKILIIDDNPKILDKLSEYFRMNRIDTITIENGENALEIIAKETPDIVILDILMPGKDGFEVLKEIRHKYDLPVIMLTAKGEDTDIIVGLEMGADDYLAKPFNARELLARIRAVVRRSKDRQEIHSKTVGSGIHAASMFLNFDTQTLVYRNKKTMLTLMEFKLMKALMQRPDRIFLRDELMTIISGIDNAYYDRSIDAHISRLRSKINDITGNPAIIKTIHGRGYMFLGQ